MAEVCMRLPNLTPAVALAKLATVAAQRLTPLSSFLTIRVRVVRAENQRVHVSLVIPQGQGKNQTVQVALIQALNAAHGSPATPVADQYQPDDLKFWPGVAWLLVNSTGTGQPAQIDETRFLVVGRGLSAVQAQAVHQHLRLDATGGVSVAVARGPQGETVHVFAARSEVARAGTVRSSIESGFFDHCLILVAYVESAQWFYLPDRSKLVLSAEALTNAARLLRELAATWRGTEAEAVGEFFGLAIFPLEPGPDTTQYALLPLAQAQFEDDLALTPGLARNLTFQVYALTEGLAEQQTLAAKIRAADPPMGYVLRLVASPEHDLAELAEGQQWEHLYAEQQRLLEALNDVQQDLQNQQARGQRRPMLLRFTAAQLPALGDVLRSFPLRVLRDGGLLYGFQATRRHPAGLHFLLIWPDQATMDQLNPLFQWQQPHERPMRFWLDPQWARHYYSAGNQHLVFVPHYQALFPPVHVWEQAASDRHWGDALRQFLLEAEAGPVPEYAERIYVCETLPETLGRRPTIEVTVLNKAELKPLHVQLGWLNEQLLVAQRAEVEHYVQVAADSLIQEELAQAWLPRAEAAQAEFNRVAAATRQDLQATLEKLLAEVSAEMAAQVAAMQQTVAETRRQIQADTQAVQAAQADTQQTRADMQRLQARLKALHQTHSAMQGRARQMDQLEQQAATEAAKVEAAVRDLKARIEVAAQARMAVAAEVAHELEQLQDTRATLRRQLAEFRER